MLDEKTGKHTTIFDSQVTATINDYIDRRHFDADSVLFDPFYDGERLIGFRLCLDTPGWVDSQADVYGHYHGLEGRKPLS